MENKKLTYGFNTGGSRFFRLTRGNCILMVTLKSFEGCYASRLRTVECTVNRSADIFLFIKYSDRVQ